MAQFIEENLFQIIKKDDIKAFNALMEKTQCGAYRLGRFPVLSLLYLYKSRKILTAYEEAFLRITSFEVLREPVEVSKKFSAKAGKCLRLYLDEVVSPLEMLLVSDKTRRLKRVFPQTKPSAAIKGRLQSIYSIKYSLSIKFEGDEIIIDKRPLSYREKKNIATACLCSVLAVTLTVGVPVTTVFLIPKPVEGEVRKLSQIDFNSDNVYTLKKDITLPDNYCVEKVNCEIIGEGHKLILGKGAKLGELSGKMSGITIDSSGEAIFTSVSDNAVIENVTVNVSTSVTATESTALIAITNYGTIDGVTVNVRGSLTALASENDGTNELTFGGIVLNNTYRTNSVIGTIKNCTVKYSDFSLKGEAEANAAFGGVAGVNNGYLQNCTVIGKITADTFDVAGVCSVNNGLLSRNLNEAELLQTSADTGWNPIVSGIVINNTYAVENCQNTGKITAVSSCVQNNSQDENPPAVSAAGIAYLSSYSISACINGGAITASGIGEAYVGGISARSYARLSGCLSSGDITVKANNIYAGGILGCSEVYYEASFFGYNFIWGEAYYCINESKITADASDGNAYIGGIAGLIKETGIEQQKRDEDGSIVNYTAYYGGGVTNSYFIGEFASDISYFGNIVGACGANIYESNTYTSGNMQYHNFESNYYVNNSFNALGTTVMPDGSLKPAEDKEATSASIEDIQNSEGYKSILSSLNK